MGQVQGGAGLNQEGGWELGRDRREKILRG